MLGQNAFVNGAGIRVDASFKGLWMLFTQSVEQHLQLFAQHIVIVISPCISRYPAAGTTGLRCMIKSCECLFGSGVLGVVGQCADNRALNAGQCSLGVAASLIA